MRRNPTAETNRKKAALKGRHTTENQQPTTENYPLTTAPPYFPAAAPALIIPAISIPSIRASTFSMLAPVSVHAST